MLRGCLVAGWVIAMACCVGDARGTEVDADVSAQETYVGLPIVLRINVNNAVDHETPIMPEVDGLRIEPAGPPAVSSQTIEINGRRMKRSTVSYLFRVTPLREGTFTIPPVKVTADNLTTMTKVVRVVASKSENDDLLFVEISGSQRESYVGQALDLTLKIWIRPYRNAEYRIELDDGDMWQTISDQTAGGSFQSRLEELAQNRRRPGGQRVLRQDSSGQESEYYLYEIDTTVYPDRPTVIDGQDVRIVVNYPVELGRARNPLSMFDDDFFNGTSLDDRMFGSFSRRLTVTKSRPIVGEAAIDPIVVKPVPTEGRPGDYVGSVGQYTITTSATPQRVQVGDPITLHIGIGGDGPMDVLRAPPLALQPNLVKDFKVPNEPLAGSVNGSEKTFSTTIRPLREGVIEIPPIRYTYFDPDSEQFVTTESQPIPIEVDQADVLALDAIVGNGGRTGRPPTKENRTKENRADSQQPSNIVSPPSLFAGSDTLRAVPRETIWSTLMIGLLVGPPLIFVTALAFAYRSLPSGWVSASRQFQRGLRNSESGSQIAAAMERYLVSRFRLETGRLSRDQTIGSLRAAGRHDLAIRLERLYHGEDRLSEEQLEERKGEAESLFREVHGWRIRSASNVRFDPAGSASALWWLLALAGAMVIANESTAAQLELSLDQQRQVLDEALIAYQTAVQSSETSVALERYRDAANKLQWLVDSGVRNDRLYFNLAEASRGAGLWGRSIANYRRALRLDPANTLYHSRLLGAEAVAGITHDEDNGLMERARRINDILLTKVSPRFMLSGGFVAWFILWIALSSRVLGVTRSWRGVVCLALMVTLATGTAYLLRVTEFNRDGEAVLTASTVSLHEGDGDEFPEVANLVNREGRVVRVLEQRGDWIHIATASGLQGWIHSEQGELI